MSDFQIRATGTYEQLATTVDTIRFQMGVPESVVYQHEDGNRTHIHVYLFSAVYKIDKLRRVCREFFVGNSDFAIKAKAGKGKSITLEGAVRYGSRNGQLHFTNQTGFDEGRITTMENEFRKTKVAVKVPHYQEVMNRFFDSNPNIHDELETIMCQPDAEEFSQWNFIKVRAKRFAFETNGYLWTPKAGQEYKMISMTFAMRHGLRINPQDKINM